MIKNKNIEQLIHKYNENRLSHVFLIETNDKKNALNDIISFIKYINCPNQFEENCTSCNLCHLISSNQFPNVSIIYPDGQAIKKSQMEELKILFSHKPYLSKYNNYIINDAEKFNSSSANTMLKFIEEPENDTIGFLITNNKENVISTIKSRCEIINAYYEEGNIHYDEELTSLAIRYVYDIEFVKNKSIVINKKIIDKKLEKNQMCEFFQIILQIYLDLLKGKIEYESLQPLKYYKTPKIIKRIQLVNDILDKLNYNVNINLLLDGFVLRLED